MDVIHKVGSCGCSVILLAIVIAVCMKACSAGAVETMQPPVKALGCFEIGTPTAHTQTNNVPVLGFVATEIFATTNAAGIVDSITCRFKGIESRKDTVDGCEEMRLALERKGGFKFTDLLKYNPKMLRVYHYGNPWCVSLDAFETDGACEIQVCAKCFNR